ncbi:MAG TPA: SdpI family protein [bacterium]|nr:SdpI family protein [bacterium]HPN33637.1 SdpI family protein [bacterium]
MKWQLKRELLPLAVLLVMALTAWFVYPTLPDRVPTHFNIHGEPDDYSGKAGFTAFTLGGCIVLYLVLTFIPWLDPFRKKIEQRYETFLKFRNLTLVFFAIIFFLSLHAARTGRFEPRWLGFGFGALFIALGNYLPQLPRNFFFGVRSPWTLASEEVWKRTHIISGYGFVAGGLLMILLALCNVNMIWSMLGIMAPISLFCTFVYPYFLFKKLQKENGKEVQL